MKIKRDGDAIYYQYEDGEGGEVVGGTFGLIGTVEMPDEADIERYWLHCAQRMEPSTQTAEQVLRWAQETFDLEPLPTGHMKMALQRANLAANLFPNRYSEPHISPEMSDGELERSILEGHARRQAAMEASDEELGIRLRGFRLPDTPRNRPLYEEGRRFMEEHYPHHPAPPPHPKAVVREAEPCVFVEETQGHISGDGLAAFSLVRHMAKRMGVSAEDIATRSPHFMGYVHVLAEEGELPTLQEFLAGKA